MTNIITDKQKIQEILTRGVEEVFIKEDLEKQLYSGKKLRIKLGIDPTSPNIHLGRAVPLRKMRAFQDLGHQVVLIIGDYTAKIGDPSDKLDKRPMLSDEQIKENLKTYLQQISLILKMDEVEVRYNSEWLKNMNFFEISKLFECFTVQQMSKRRNFKDRLDAGVDVFMVEFMYPALQGYDSVVVDADVELGGFDQLFNLKAGRIIQKKYGKKEQDIMTVSMLEGTDGRKMSSSWGNIISLLSSPEDKFGKVMSLRDDLILKYFLLATDLTTEKINEIEKDLKNGASPMHYKKMLGREIVKLYHTEKEAFEAEESWNNIFSKKEIPENVPQYKVENGALLVDVLLGQKLISSKSEFRRLVDGGAITNLNTKEKIEEPLFLAKEGVYKIGKKNFIKIITE